MVVQAGCRVGDGCPLPRHQQLSAAPAIDEPTNADHLFLFIARALPSRILMVPYVS